MGAGIATIALQITLERGADHQGAWRGYIVFIIEIETHVVSLQQAAQDHVVDEGGSGRRTGV